jgi:hypothetical protein
MRPIIIATYRVKIKITNSHAIMSTLLSCYVRFCKQIWLHEKWLHEISSLFYVNSFFLCQLSSCFVQSVHFFVHFFVHLLCQLSSCYVKF